MTNKSIFTVKMRALVTGATGFIGSHLAEMLIKKGYEVTCLARRTSSLRWIEGLEVKIIYGDCTEMEALKGMIKGFDYIYHLAGVTKAIRGELYFRENSVGTENIVKAASEENPSLKKFIYLSSLSAFGPSPDGRLPEEDEIPHPVSDYGRSKLSGEEAVLRHKYSFPVVIIRPAAVYGPRDRDIYFFFKLIKKGIIPLWGGERFLSLLYVDDLIEGIISAGEKGEGVYFLSDGEIYSVESVVDRIADTLGVKAIKIRIPEPLLFTVASLSEGFYRITGRPPLINRDKMTEAIQRYWICGISRAIRDLGFKPKVFLDDGIRRTATWYRNHGWL
jgi:nucleoside-diphosphate-sugar epimerase